MRIVSQTKNEYGLFLLHADERNLVGALSVPTVYKPVPQAVFQAILRKCNLRHGVKSTALARVAETLAAGQTVPQTLVARGTPPVVPGTMHLRYAPGATPSEGDVDIMPAPPSQGLRVSSVRAGDVIAHIDIDTESHPGMDIFGTELPPDPDGKVIVKAGKHVVQDGASRAFRAEIDGQVLLQGGALSVDPVFHIRHNYPRSWGDITFVGYVRIDGEVPDGVRIEGEKGIRVGGVAEACEFVTGGNIEIVGGMAGRGQGRIRAGGNVRAHYLNDVTVEAEGNVSVAKEVIGSRVYTLGRGDFETASVVGGEVVALAGICTRSVSSQIDVPTWLIAGIDYRVRDQLLNVNKAIIRDERKQQELLNRVGPMLKRAKGIPPPLHVREEIDDLMVSIRQLQRSLELAREKSAAIMDAFVDKAVPCISVVGKLHIGAKMTVGRVEGMAAMRRDGPISIVEDEEGQVIAIKPGLLVKTMWAKADKAGEARRAAGGMAHGEI